MLTGIREKQAVDHGAIHRGTAWYISRSFRFDDDWRVHAWLWYLPMINFIRQRRVIGTLEHWSPHGLQQLDSPRKTHEIEQYWTWDQKTKQPEHSEHQDGRYNNKARFRIIGSLWHHCFPGYWLIIWMCGKQLNFLDPEYQGVQKDTKGGHQHASILNIPVLCFE